MAKVEGAVFRDLDPVVYKLRGTPLDFVRKGKWGVSSWTGTFFGDDAGRDALAEASDCAPRRPPRLAAPWAGTFLAARVVEHAMLTDILQAKLAPDSGPRKAATLARWYLVMLLGTIFRSPPWSDVATVEDGMNQRVARVVKE